MYCRVKSLFCFIDVELGTRDNCRDIPKPCFLLLYIKACHIRLYRYYVVALSLVATSKKCRKPSSAM